MDGQQKKRCTVEDGTGQALVFFSGDCCRSWLKLPANVWKILQDNVLPHEGEFVYLSSVKKKEIFESNFNLVKGPKDQKLFSFDPEIFLKNRNHGLRQSVWPVRSYRFIATVASTCGDRCTSSLTSSPTTKVHINDILKEIKDFLL